LEGEKGEGKGFRLSFNQRSLVADKPQKKKRRHALAGGYVAPAP